MGYQILFNGVSRAGTCFGLTALQYNIREAKRCASHEAFAGNKIEVVDENHTKVFWSSEKK